MSPSEVTVLAEEQGSAGGSLRAGPSPDPAQLSSPREPGTRDPTDTRVLRWPKRGLWALGWGGSSCRLLPCRPPPP